MKKCNVMCGPGWKCQRQHGHSGVHQQTVNVPQRKRKESLEDLQLVDTAGHDRHIICKMGKLLLGGNNPKDCYSADAVFHAMKNRLKIQDIIDKNKPKVERQRRKRHDDLFRVGQRLSLRDLASIAGGAGLNVHIQLVDLQSIKEIKAQGILHVKTSNKKEESEYEEDTKYIKDACLAKKGSSGCTLFNGHEGRHKYRTQ